MTVRFAVLVMIRLAACLWVVSQRGCAMAQQPSVVPNSATPPFLLARFDDDVYGAIPPRHHTPGQNHLTPQQLPALGEDLGPEDELYIVPNHRQAAERSTVRLTPKNGATFWSAKPCIIIMTYVSGPSRNLSLFSSLSPPNMPLGDSMFQVEHFVAARGTRRSEKVNTFSVLVYWFWVVIMTSLGWIGCGRPMCPWSSKTVLQRRSPHPQGLEPEQLQLPGPIEPASCKDGPELHTGGIDGTGIDIRRHRCSKGPGGRRRPPNRPEVGCLLRRVRGWGTGRPTGGPGSCHWWQLWQLRRCP